MTAAVAVGLVVFLLIGLMVFPAGPFIRPHPLLWRLVFGAPLPLSLCATCCARNHSRSFLFSARRQAWLWRTRCFWFCCCFRAAAMRAVFSNYSTNLSVTTPRCVCVCMSSPSLALSLSHAPPPQVMRDYAVDCDLTWRNVSDNVRDLRSL